MSEVLTFQVTFVDGDLIVDQPEVLYRILEENSHVKGKKYSSNNLLSHLKYNDSKKRKIQKLCHYYANSASQELQLFESCEEIAANTGNDIYQKLSPSCPTTKQWTHTNTFKLMQLMGIKFIHAPFATTHHIEETALAYLKHRPLLDGMQEFKMQPGYDWSAIRHIELKAQIAFELQDEFEARLNAVRYVARNVAFQYFKTDDLTWFKTVFRYIKEKDQYFKLHTFPETFTMTPKQVFNFVSDMLYETFQEDVSNYYDQEKLLEQREEKYGKFKR